MSLGTDLSGALEVNPNPGADSPDAASAPSDREPTGDAAESEDDRKALNVAKRAERLAEQLRGDMSQLSQTVLAAVGNRTPAPPAEPQRTEAEPHDAAALNAAMEAGDLPTVIQMVQDNTDFRIRRASQENQQVFDRKTQAREARSFLVTQLGLADPNRPENQKILEIASQLQRDYPDVFGKDAAAAQGMASGIFWRKAARGEVEVPDLRQETLQRDKEPAGATSVGPGESEERTVKPDWNAKDRGLPAEMANQFRDWGLEEVLERSNDPRTEKVRRETIMGAINDGNHGGD